MDHLLAGKNQPQTNQPNGQAGNKSFLVMLQAFPFELLLEAGFSAEQRWGQQNPRKINILDRNEQQKLPYVFKLLLFCLCNVRLCCIKSRSCFSQVCVRVCVCVSGVCVCSCVWSHPCLGAMLIFSVSFQIQHTPGRTCVCMCMCV